MVPERDYTCASCDQVFLTLVKAEGVGFEPTMSFPIPVFKTGAIGH